MIYIINIIKNKYLLLSLSLHILLILFSIKLIYQPSLEIKFEIKSGIKYNPIISAYTITKQHYSQVATERTRHTLKPLPKSSPISSNLNLNLNSKKITTEPLLKILHTAIAANQYYPENALILNQSGTVRVGFLINPEGKISHITLIKSSGFNTIDSAAIDAVNASSPIKTAYLYLHIPKQFSVDIIFQS